MLCLLPVAAAHDCMQMVRILVAAGADVDACLAPEIAHAGDPALAHMLFTVNKDNAESAKQMLQILIGEARRTRSDADPAAGRPCRLSATGPVVAAGTSAPPTSAICALAQSLPVINMCPQGRSCPEHVPSRT